MNQKEQPPLQSTIHIAPLEGLANVSELSINVSQKVIIASEDKVRLCLVEHLKSTEKKKGWVTPMGLFLAMAGTLITANFRDILLSASSWATVYLIAALVFLAWLVYAIIQARHSESIDDVIAALKKGAVIEKLEAVNRPGKSGPLQ